MNNWVDLCNTVHVSTCAVVGFGIFRRNTLGSDSVDSNRPAHGL